MFSWANSSAGGMVEVPTPTAAARVKKFALASPVVGKGVEFSQAECSLHSGKYSLSLFCYSDTLLWPRIIQQSDVHTHTH